MYNIFVEIRICLGTEKYTVNEMHVYLQVKKMTIRTRFKSGYINYSVSNKQF